MNEQERFEKFTLELTQLSKKYGVIIETFGGVHFDNPADPYFEDLEYTNDASSHDLFIKSFQQKNT